MRGLKAEAIFAALDNDGNGYVTRDEIDVLGSTDVYEAVCELFAAADASGVAGSVAGDDQLTHEEWMKGIIFHMHYKTECAPLWFPTLASDPRPLPSWREP